MNYFLIEKQGENLNKLFDIKFKYDGFWRHVSNVTFEPETQTLIGFEMRKSGKFSYKVKRYSYEKIFNLQNIPTMERRGPIIGLPNE